VTVAAVIVPRDAGEALADAAGRAAVRRIVDIAWAGGALPLVVVADDPIGSIAAALAGSPAQLLPAGGSAGRAYRTGADAAVEAVVGTDGWLLWPGDRTWVDPETVTSLIEAHGSQPKAVLRPAVAGRPGWPVLVPLHRTELVDDLMAVGARLDASSGALLLELGDPGSLLTLDVPIDEVPPYLGPSAPVVGPPPEWGAAAADEPD
jgi:CTP:molybdopterin cytidylyltransferase MocA